MSNPFVEKKKILENEFAYAIYDGFPVSKGHMLVIAKADVTQIFELKKNEYISCFELLIDVKNYIQNKYNPDGFNIGVNCNTSAGQTVPVPHIHIIPRYKGDIEDARGGIRNISDVENIIQKLLQMLAFLLK